MDTTLQLLSTLSYGARIGFPCGTITTSYWPWLNIALLLSAISFSLWGPGVAWWGKYAQPKVILRSSVSFSSKPPPTRDQVRSGFAGYGSTTICRNLNSGHGGRIYLKLDCPIDEFVPNGGTIIEESLGTGKNSASSDLLSNFICGDGSLFTFGYGQEQIVVEEASFPDVCVGLCRRMSFESQHGWNRLQALKLGSQWNCSSFENLGCPTNHFVKGSLQSPNRGPVKFNLTLPEDFVNCIDVRDSTVRLWDVQERKCLLDTLVQNRPGVRLWSGIVINDNRSSLYVWDPRNSGKPLSFSLGNESSFQNKVGVCDGLQKRVFDLRMAGAAPVEVYPKHAN